jgi:peptidoglycan/LPS O-acetylase OafA/YrhL
MIRRLSRLYAAMMVAWLLGLCLTSSYQWSEYPGAIFSVPVMLLSVVMCQYGGQNIVNFNELWAASAEFIIYIVFTFTVPYLRLWFLKSTQPRANPILKYAFWIGFPLANYLAIVIPLIVYFDDYSYFAANVFSCHLYFTPWSRLPIFFIGVWGGYVAKHYLMPAWEAASEAKKVKAGHMMDVTIVTIGLVVLFVIPYLDTLTSAELANYIGTSGLAPVSILVLLMLSLDTGRVASAMSWWPLKWLGKRSYEIYVMHMNVVRVCNLIYVNTAYRYFYTMPFVLIVAHLVNKYATEP